jgi:hypothetical protein
MSEQKLINMGPEQRLPINEFNLNMMVENPSIVMIAKRGSGKSWVCKAILNHFRKIPVGLIIAPTDRMNCFYGNFFPDTYIHYEYKSSIIENLLQRQDLAIEKEKAKQSQGKKYDPRAFIVMDDCLSKKGTWMRDQPISELLFNGRHYKVMYILTMQYPLGIVPELRSNFDYIFLLAEDFITNIKRLYDNYAGMFPSLNAFKEVFEQLTKDFGSMVIVNRGARSSFLEKIYFYRAPKIDDKSVVIGCKQFQYFHKKNYNPDWRRKNKTFDINEYCTKHKRDKVPIKVDKKEYSLYGNQDVHGTSSKSLVVNSETKKFHKPSIL